MVTFESGELQVLFHKRKSPYLMVSFAPAAVNADGKNAFFDTLFKRNDVSTLCFVASKPNWYPVPDTMAAIEAAQPYIAEFKERLGLGYSMGGYGVLRYARPLDIRVCMAMSPNFALNTRDLPERFHEPARAQLLAMQGRVVDEEQIKDAVLSRGDAYGRAYVFYDSKIEMDTYHVDRIDDELPIVRVPMPYATHQLQRFFVSPSAMREMVDIARAGADQRMRNFARRQIRKYPSIRTFSLAPRLSTRHFRWAQNMFLQHGSKLPANELAALTNGIAQRALDLGQAEWAVTVLTEALARSPGTGVTANLLTEARVAAAGATGATGAEDKLREQIAANPKALFAYEQLFNLLMKNEDFLSCAQLMDEALRVMPDTYTLLLRAAAAQERLQNFPLAIDLARRAIALSPDPKFPTNRVRLAQMLLRNRQIDEAEKLLEETLADKPNAPETLRTLAYVYERRGKIAKAIELMRTAVDISPKNENLRKFLAKLTEELEDRKAKQRAAREGAAG